MVNLITDEAYDGDTDSVTSEPESPWLNKDDFPDDDTVLFDADKEGLFKRKSYVVHGALGHSALVNYTHRITIDTGAGPNLVRYDILPEEWKNAIEQHPDPGMCGASGNQLTLHGVLPVNVTIRDSRTRVYFGVVSH